MVKDMTPEELEKFNENYLLVMDDSEKWIAAEWHMRLYWVNHFGLYHQRILSTDPTFDDIYLFWVKLQGLFELIPPDVLYSYYAAIENVKKDPALEQKFKPLMEQFLTIIKTIERCLEILTEIRIKFSTDEMIMLLDLRTHVCHPIASFYRLRLDKKRNIIDRYEDINKLDIQKAIFREYGKYNTGDEKQTMSRIAKAYASKIPLDQVLLLKSEIQTVADSFKAESFDEINEEGSKL